ncbi:MAG: HAD-IIB family hydrolase [Parachlamydiales bacterium]|nr:HAD-IIB family hydrolase [Parachlamydiales bacterium]
MAFIIALDIDGTLTTHEGPIPDPVSQFLKKLADEGHDILFLTGRPFSFAFPVVQNLNFSFHLGVQNGSTLVDIPSKKIIQKKYIPAINLPLFESIILPYPFDFLVEGGMEAGDKTFFRKERYSDEDLKYLAYREKIAGAPFIPVTNFAEANLTSFPLIKIFGPEDDLRAIEKEITKRVPLSVTVIKDPFRTEKYIALVTQQDVNKGTVIRDYKESLALKPKVIVAGDDINDLPMYTYSDISIAMETGPQLLIDKAQIVAKKAADLGIIDALNQAMRDLG